MSKRLSQQQGKPGKVNGSGGVGNYLAYQHWPVVFGAAEDVEEGGETASAANQKVYKIQVGIEEFRNNRDERCIYEKLLEVAPQNLFPSPSYYRLQYRFAEKGSSLINVEIANNDHVERAFQAFTIFRTQRLRDHLLLRIVPAESGAPLFNPLPIKRYKDVSFRTQANLAKILNDQYLEGKLKLREVSKLLSMDLKNLQREVYLMLSPQDKEDHEYLIYGEPTEPPKPDSLYMAGKIDIKQYEDSIYPEKKAAREQAALGYPQPEEPHACVICSQQQAFIPCLQCERRVCSQCLVKHFHQSPEQTSFSLLHHIYCRKHGKPRRTSIPPLPQSRGELSFPIT